MKIALIGLGGRGSTYAHFVQYYGSELVAVCDVNPDQLKKPAETINLGNTGAIDLNSVRKYLSYEEMVKAEPDLDMIDICLPTDLHCEYSCRAMKDGFHVICEKPMALNSKDCRKMIRVSEQTGKKLMIAQVLRLCLTILTDIIFSEIRSLISRQDSVKFRGARLKKVICFTIPDTLPYIWATAR